jgi:hypothetical protein
MKISPRPPGLVTTRELRRLGDDGQSWRRRVANGTAIQVKRGAFCSKDDWDGLYPSERHLLIVYAVADSHPTAIFTGMSAAALYGLPMLGSWPIRAQLALPAMTGGRSSTVAEVSSHPILPGDVIDFAPLKIAAPIRAMTDLASTTPFAFAVQIVDRALRTGLVAEQSLREFRPTRTRGSRSIERAFAFATGLADSPGESMSRALIHELGFPEPQLQTIHNRGGGGFYRTDFEWPEYRVIGEYDGVGKYLKSDQLGSKTPGEAVYAEKRREDELRRTSGSTVARWGTPELRAPAILRRILLDAGLPIMR